MLRRRLVLEWWAAVLAVGPVVATMALAPSGLLDEAWSLALMVAAVVLLLAIAVGAVVAIYRFPVAAAPWVPGRFRGRDVAAAAVEVRHGRAVEPAILQSAAIDLARRGLRVAPLTFAGLPLSGTSLAASLHNNGFGVAATILAAVFVAAGAAGLGQCRRVQHRLNRLEDTGPVAPAADGRASQLLGPS